MKKLLSAVLIISFHCSVSAGSISVVFNGVPEANDNMGNAVALMRADDVSTDGMVVGVEGEDGMGAIMYYSDFDADPVYVKYQGNTGDKFGHAIAVGFFNDDSYMDIAVGVPYADHNGLTNAGEVYIFYGSATGPNWSNPQVLRDTATPQGSAYFGYSLAAADVVDGLGRSELIVGIPYYNVGSIINAGAIRIYYRNPGWTSALVHQGVSGVLGSLEFNDRFGWAVAADADTNIVAVGVPYEAVGSDVDAGIVQVFKVGNNASIVANEYFHQDRPSSMQGVVESGDNFGYSVAIDYYGILVGVPGEDLTINNDEKKDAGVVQRIGINRNNLSATDSELYRQGDTTFDGDPEDGDEFGSAVSLFWDDVCIGAGMCGIQLRMHVGVPGEDVNRGVVQLNREGDKLTIDQGQLGYSRETGDRFGGALAVNINDILIGVPKEDIGNTTNAGAAHYVKIDGFENIVEYRLLQQY